MSGTVPGADLDDLVGGPVAVRIRQGDDPVGATLRNEQGSLRRDRHEARSLEALGEDGRPISRRQDELGSAAAAGVEVDAQQDAAEGPGHREQNGQGHEGEEGQVPKAPHMAPMLAPRYRFPRRPCSISIASKSALKLPTPKPRDPWRSMISKKKVGRSCTGRVKIWSR